VEALCRAAAARGITHLALTDTDSVAGAIDFWNEAKECGLTPILGAEVTSPAPVTILARSHAGWRRLCRILTDRHCDPAFSLGEALAADRQDLVVLASDPDWLEALARRSGPADLFVALDSPGPRQALLAFARQSGLPPVAAPRVLCAESSGHPLHRLLRAIDLNTRLSRLPEAEVAPPGAWLQPSAAVERAFADCPEAVARSGRLAEECALPRPPWGEIVLPRYRDLDDGAVLAELRRRCEAGFARRYRTVTSAHRARLAKELDLVAEKGFAGYFLVVHDIVSGWPRTCGRGSAAASLIAYLLGITHVDPVRHDLFFERFLNSGRVDPPDIDVDFAWDERDDVLAAVFARYGIEQAAMVSTRICFRGRAAVREVAKVFGLPEDEIGTIARRLARTWSGHAVEEVVRGHPLFADLDLVRPWPEILSWAGRLEGHPRHLSVHPGGVVLAPTGIADHVPMQPSAKGVRIIQWDKDAAEEGGLVKIDLLGNRSLAVIRDALAAVETRHGIRIPYASFDPIDDRRTIHMMAAGETVGVFYVESPAMRQLQRKTGRGDYEHLVIHSSIIRPAANAYIREYVRRLHGARYRPLHPLLERLMPETYGIMVYQEDVARVAIAMAGFDPASADELRKVLSKKHRARRLRDFERRFGEGALARGFAPRLIEEVWRMILSFAGYSFCKPHSASYALVSFKSAYLKAHYPAEFMAAVLSNQGGYYSPFAYVSECRRLGLAVDLPDVDESRIPYTGEAGRVRIGLMQIQGLSAQARQAIVEERERGPYRSFEALLRRVDLDPSDLRLLIRAGACDGIARGKTRPQLTWRALEWEEERRRGRRRPLLSLPGRARERQETLLPLFDRPAGSLPAAPPPDEITVLRQEMETLGFLASRHPLTLYRREMARLPIVEAKDLARHVGRRVLTVGWYVTGKVVETRAAEPMEFVSFEDTTALYETTLFPEVYKRFCRLLTHARPYLLEGTVEEDFGAVALNVERVAFLDEAARGATRRGERRQPSSASSDTPSRRIV
jgi:DNA-directed DNA polymerase III PolC